MKTYIITDDNSNNVYCVKANSTEEAYLNLYQKVPECFNYSQADLDTMDILSINDDGTFTAKLPLSEVNEMISNDYHIYELNDNKDFSLLEEV